MSDTKKELLKYVFPVKQSFKINKISLPKISKFKQTDSNCRIYAMLNNLYLNTGIIANDINIKQAIGSYGVDVIKGGQPILAGAVISKEINNIKCYYIEPFKDPKLFAKLLQAGYSFVYSRTHDKNLTDDVREDDDIDNILTNEGGRHATNICFIDKKLTELGSRGDKSKYNVFTYSSIGFFTKSIKAGTIKPILYFLAKG